MTNPKGVRRGTRYMFGRGDREHGIEPLSTYYRDYKRGDYVVIKGHGAFQKGMPHKVYHGKTGVVFNVARRALGVIVTKRHRGRILAKRINVRVEHVKPSNFRAGSKKPIAQPRKAHTVQVKGVEIDVLAPLPYEIIA